MLRARHLAAAFAVILAGMPLASEPLPDDCNLRGEVIQWIADYCMLVLQTDDEIAASGCIEENLSRRFPSACVAKAHYQRAMCGLFVAAESTEKSIDECVSDPDFMGRTVLRGGVGG